MIKKIIIGNANGNTFVIIDNNDKISTKIIKNLCFQYKTDGLIHINYLDTNNIIMDYYNNDGTWETLCLNGLTCVGLVLKNKFLKKDFVVQCGPKKYKLFILNNNKIKIELPNPEYKSQKIKYDDYEGYYIDSGAKHFVININSLNWPNNTKLINDAQKIRYDIEKFPDGINVNFYKKINKNTIEVKTYEKGVEKLMDSCASGSYASAFHFDTNQDEIFIINIGGEFSIQLNNNNNNCLINTGKLEYINS